MLDLNSKERFSDRVADYVQSRPGYPEGILAILREHVGRAGSWNIADVGSGTGIFTRVLLEAGHLVFGIEPNAAMRAAAERSLACFERFKSIDGHAGQTGLPDASVEVVTAAQAFHWFDVESSKLEFRRILRPAGMVALIWNTRTLDTPFARAYEDFISRWATDYQQVGQKHRCAEALFTEFFSERGHNHHALPNHQRLDLAGLKGRLLSSSYIPKEPGERFDRMIGEISGLFEQHGRDGYVTLEYATDVYVGRID